MEYKYDVFISYSRKDYVDEYNNEIPGNPISIIKEYLKKAGISYWFDEDGILTGDQFAKVIVKNIKQSRILLFISSENSINSDWTCKEIATATKLKRKIIPFRIDDYEYNEDVMLYLVNLDFVTYYTNPQSSLQELVRSIKRHNAQLDEQTKTRTGWDSPQIEAIRTEITLMVKNAKKAFQAQYTLIDNIRKKLKSAGINEKRCPVCGTPVALEEKYCYCCGFYFPHLYGLCSFGNDPEKEIDPSYLAKMKGWWASIDNKTDNQSNEEQLEDKPILPTKPKKEKGVFFVNNVKFRMIPVEGGSFNMGNDETHKVSLSSYKIGETPVTQELWTAVMGDNPSKFKGEQRPVEQVTWNDCQKFIQKLNKITNKEFRLPTEAEWEFAARGGNKGLKTKYSGGNNLEDLAWCNLNCSESDSSTLNYGTHNVRAKSPNELRIYDMSGNVWEWCNDWYGELAAKTEVNPTGPQNGTTKVCRGGSWNSESECCKVTFRNYGGLYKRDYSYGLRLAL